MRVVGRFERFLGSHLVEAEDAVPDADPEVAVHVVGGVSLYVQGSARHKATERYPRSKTRQFAAEEKALHNAN